MRDLELELRAGLRALDLGLTDQQVGLLLDYLALMQKWNKVYNLTALRDPALMLSHHLLDSLALIPALQRQLTLASSAAADRPLRLLDVGAGAGLPGVLIAICCPQVRVDCVDAVAKKAAFVQQVALTLGLSNLRGLHARVESLALEQAGYDVVVSRAFAALADFVTWSANALAPGAVWLAMKGKAPDEEMAQLPAGVEVFHVEPLTVPSLDAQRCLVWMRKVASST